ncbi:MAG: 5'/3'-nucleotidase SurE [Endomicrobiia bacterium]
MKKILITNDDGIFAIGLRPLVEGISSVGNVIVVVPDKERSAVSHSLTLQEPIRARKIYKNTYILNGTPADCVRFGIISICKNKVDLVISGINFGANLGQDVIYSGTVGAAREAVFMGYPSFAISLVSKAGKNFQTAAKFAVKIAKFLLRNKFQKKFLLNVNVPDLPPNKITGIEITSLGERVYEDIVHHRKDPYGLSYYWLKSRLVKGKNIPGTDITAIKNKKISITPLSIDHTDFSMIEELKKYEF